MWAVFSTKAQAVNILGVQTIQSLLQLLNSAIKQFMKEGTQPCTSNSLFIIRICGLECADPCSREIGMDSKTESQGGSLDSLYQFKMAALDSDPVVLTSSLCFQMTHLVLASQAADKHSSSFCHVGLAGHCYHIKEFLGQTDLRNAQLKKFECLQFRVIAYTLNF